MRTTPRHRPRLFVAVAGLIAAAFPLNAGAAPATTQGALMLNDGRQSIALPWPAGLGETPQSTAARRILQSEGGKITAIFSLLPPDQPTDPAAAASMVQTSQGAMRQAMGENLLTPPESQPDPRFALVMHWRYRISAEQTVDATRRWIKAGTLAVQCDLTVKSSDAAAIKSANEAVMAVLLNAPGTAVESTGAPAREKLAGGIEFTPPAQFEDIGSAQGGRTHDYVSEDRATEMLLTVLPEGTTLDSASGPKLLAETTQDLAGQSLLAGPELLSDSAVVAIHWSFNKGGKPAQGYRLFQKVGQRVVRCELMTTGDEKAARHVAERTLVGMSAPEAEAAGAAELPPPGTKPAVDDAQKAAALLAMAGNYAAVGQVDAARTKYQDLLRKYPQTPSAALAKKRLAELSKAAKK
jgi:hypothetical protein